MKRHTLVVAFLLCVSTPAAGQTADREASRADVADYGEDLLSRRFPADGPGGAVLVARGDTVLFRGARGLADVDRRVPLRADSVFRIGSVTKQFAAAGLLTLVEAGRVRLDDPLSRYLPDYPGGSDITLRQLLNHTSGIMNYTAIPGYMNGSLPPVRRDVTTAQLIDVFNNGTPEFPPGTAWRYNNSGYVLVGAVIEAVTRQPWHVYLRTALFEPLGMRNTGYGLDRESTRQQVPGYSYDGNTLIPARQMSLTQAHAAGALLSTVDDLLTWNRALHEGRVLRNASYTQMITPVGRASGPGYGLGLFTGKVRGRNMLWHTGGIFGFISVLTYLPGPDLTVVVLENDDVDNDRRGGESADSVAWRLNAVALGHPYPEMRPVPVETAALEAAEGVYRWGNVTRVLRVVNERLTVQRDGDSEPAALTPIASDDFLYADGFNRLKLERDGGGRVTGVRYFADGEGAGEVGPRTGDPLPALPVTVQVPRAALARLVGTYSRDDTTFTVSLEGDALVGRIGAGQPRRLRAKSPTEFELVGVGGGLVFAAGTTPAEEVRMRQDGREITLQRVP